MKNIIVDVPSIKLPIQRSPGFAKKMLSDFKLDIMGLCGFGCRYCSSNEGNYLRINRQPFADKTEEQIGKRLLPTSTPALMFRWPDVLDRLDAQLASKHETWGKGQTLVFSMLTDGFSPELVQSGLTQRVLQVVLERTSFRIRVLTKNAVVGAADWVSFFRAHRERFVVGLSTGTLDDEWARRIEQGTSSPMARLRALNRLQDAGVPTYAMLCPVFPDLLDEGELDRLIDQIRPHAVEHIWAEPFNDRNNWSIVREGYPENSFGHVWFTEVYENGNVGLWSQYATDLYTSLRDRADKEGWLEKLRYLLYERAIVEEDARKYRGLAGVLFQSAPSADGLSQNVYIAHEQRHLL